MSGQEGAGVQKKRRSGIAVMGKLVGLIRPLLPRMLAAITLGTIGHLCAIFISILAAQVILRAVIAATGGILVKSGWLLSVPVAAILAVMIIIAVARGFLHYAEQYNNHFIAFRLLAIIRHKVFAKLRTLCPAKLEGKDSGDLISIITSDIELLEVFYAHTISPIVIAVAVSVVMVIFTGGYHPLCGVLAAAAYVLAGVLIPLVNGKRGADAGMEYRTGFGELNGFVLDSIYGIDETIQYGQGEERKRRMLAKSDALGALQKRLSRLEGSQRSFTTLTILLASFAMLALTVCLYLDGSIGIDGVLTCTVAMMGSFGPVVALAGLSNNLNQTLASGERVLSLLEEEPVVAEIPEEKSADQDGADGKNIPADAAGSPVPQTPFAGGKLEHVTFAYGNETVLENVTALFAAGKITGIHGPSGCGKSTVLKLLMRFWDPQKGTVLVDKKNVRETPTARLRATESYVTQQTWLFHDTIAANIAVGRPGAKQAEIEEAARKASVHDFILTLPDGYATKVGELGDTLSGGERQRIGIARAFLHNAPFLLLDEPTSNLDSLNEGIILKSLKEEAAERTIVLVSHRKSTMRAADTVLEMHVPGRDGAAS